MLGMSSLLYKPLRTPNHHRPTCPHSRALSHSLAPVRRAISVTVFLCCRAAAHAPVGLPPASPHPRLSTMSTGDPEHPRIGDAPLHVMSAPPPGPSGLPLENISRKTVNSYHFAFRPLYLMKINLRSLCPRDSCS
jgi:hypothetical protein